jgi:hypothetical protein
VTGNWLKLYSEELHMKMTVFWDVTPCNPVEIDRLFRSVYCLRHQAIYRPEDGCIKHLWNVWSVSTRLHGTTSEKTFVHIRRREDPKSHLERHNSQYLHSIIRMFKSRRMMNGSTHSTDGTDEKCMQRFLSENLNGRLSVERGTVLNCMIKM